MIEDKLLRIGCWKFIHSFIFPSTVKVINNSKINLNINFETVKYKKNKIEIKSESMKKTPFGYKASSRAFQFPLWNAVLTQSYPAFLHIGLLIPTTYYTNYQLRTYYTYYVIVLLGARCRWQGNTIFFTLRFYWVSAILEQSCILLTSEAWRVFRWSWRQHVEVEFSRKCYRI